MVAAGSKTSRLVTLGKLKDVASTYFCKNFSWKIFSKQVYSILQEFNLAILNLKPSSYCHNICRIFMIVSTCFHSESKVEMKDVKVKFK